eukprot:6415532-Pyramimonas_sp.AAC.1
MWGSSQNIFEGTGPDGQSGRYVAAPSPPRRRPSSGLMSQSSPRRRRLAADSHMCTIGIAPRRFCFLERE